MPASEASDEAFTDADLARAHLIQEMHQNMGVNRAGIDVALHLLDQVHGLRRALFALRKG